MDPNFKLNSFYFIFVEEVHKVKPVIYESISNLCCLWQMDIWNLDKLWFQMIFIWKNKLENKKYIDDVSVPELRALLFYLKFFRRVFHKITIFKVLKPLLKPLLSNLIFKVIRRKTILVEFFCL